jgi:hypothetical protein
MALSSGTVGCAEEEEEEEEEEWVCGAYMCRLTNLY